MQELSPAPVLGLDPSRADVITGLLQDLDGASHLAERDEHLDGQIALTAARKADRRPQCPLLADPVQGLQLSLAQSASGRQPQVLDQEIAGLHEPPRGDEKTGGIIDGVRGEIRVDRSVGQAVLLELSGFDECPFALGFVHAVRKRDP